MGTIGLILGLFKVPKKDLLVSNWDFFQIVSKVRRQSQAQILWRSDPVTDVDFAGDGGGD